MRAMEAARQGVTNLMLEANNRNDKNTFANLEEVMRILNDIKVTYELVNYTTTSDIQGEDV